MRIRKSQKIRQEAKAKAQNDKQRPTKHTHKTKQRVARTLLKSGDELRYSRRISSSYSPSDNLRVYLVTNSVISHEFGNNRTNNEDKRKKHRKLKIFCKRLCL